MSSLQERLDDMVNPIAWKDIHQGLRGRALVVTNAFALLMCFLTALAAAGIEGGSGQTLAASTGGFLAVTCLLVIPTSLRRQSEVELEGPLFSLIELTGISPWTLASGLFLGGMSRVLLAVMLMAPFAVASILLGGVDPIGVVAGLLTLGATSIVFVSATVTVTAARRAIGSNMLLSRGYLLVLLMGFTQVSTLLVMVLDSAILQWWVVTASLLVALAGSLLLVRLAADLLTAAGSRTFRASRMILPLVPLFGAGIPAWANRPLTDADQLIGITALSVSPLLLLFASCRPSRRAPPTPFVLRDGWYPSVVYAALIFTAITLMLDPTFYSRHTPYVLVQLIVRFIEIAGLARLMRAMVDPRHTNAFAFSLALVLIMVVGGAGSATAEGLNRLGLPTGILDAFFITERSFQDLSILSLLPFGTGLAAAELARRIEARFDDV